MINFQWGTKRVKTIKFQSLPQQKRSKLSKWLQKTNFKHQKPSPFSPKFRTRIRSSRYKGSNTGSRVLPKKRRNERCLLRNEGDWAADRTQIDLPGQSKSWFDRQLCLPESSFSRRGWFELLVSRRLLNDRKWPPNPPCRNQTGPGSRHVKLTARTGSRRNR